MSEQEAQAEAEELLIASLAWQAFPDETEDPETGEHVDDYGYPAEARMGFKVGFRAGRERARHAPVEVTVPQYELIEIEMGRHEPVLSFHDGHIAGCKCLDRVFYRKTEDWASHLADASIAALAAALGGGEAEPPTPRPTGYPPRPLTKRKFG